MRRSFSRRGWVLGAAVSALLFVIAAAPGATAQRRGGGLRATIFLTQARVPSTGTERALLSFMRAHTARGLTETREPELARRKWSADMVINFSAAPGDLEFHLLFFDVQSGTREFLEEMSVYLDNRDQRTYLQRVQLPRPRFRPNHRYELVATVRRVEVGSLRFETIGEEEHRSGSVDFTQDPAPSQGSE